MYILSKFHFPQHWCDPISSDENIGIGLMNKEGYGICGGKAGEKDLVSLEF
jgi:hypothetical protein